MVDEYAHKENRNRGLGISTGQLVAHEVATTFSEFAHVVNLRATREVPKQKLSLPPQLSRYTIGAIRNVAS